MNIKKIHFVLLMLLSIIVSGASAQETSYLTRHHRFVLELGAGLPIGRSLPYFENRVGGIYFAEFQYHPVGRSFDFGVQAAFNVLHRRAFDGATIDYISGDFLLTSDYKYRISPYFTAFAGAGLGWCTVDESAKSEYGGHGVTYGGGSSGSFAAMPRIGISACNLFRLSIGYKFQEKANQNFFVSLGLTLGK